MKHLSCATTALGLSCILATFAGPLGAPAAAATDKDVTVTGCLIKAAEEDDALLVTTLARVDAPPYMADGSSSARRAPSAMRIVYWLDDHDELEGHQGRLVEVRGELEGDIDRGEVKVERKESGVEVEFKADGDRRLKARLPMMAAGPVGTSGADRDDSSEYDVVVQKLAVKNVRMVAPTCEGSIR